MLLASYSRAAAIPPVSLASEAARRLLATAARIAAAEWAEQELNRLLAVRTALSARRR